MLKHSILKTTYLYFVSLFFIFILSMMTFNFYKSYIDYLDTTNNLEKETLENIKKSLKIEVDFFNTLIKESRKNLRIKKKIDIKNNVHNAYNIVKNIYENNKNIDNIETIIIDALRKLKFNNRDYVFITRLDGEQLLLPTHPSFEGKNLLNSENKNVTKVIKDMIRISSVHKQGFYKYKWIKDNKKEYIHTKISYIKYFEPLDCFIGIGVYTEDFEKDLQKRILSLIERYKFGENKDNYIFAASYNGLSLTQPAKGKNLYEVVDKNGLKVVQELITVAKNGNGYVQYVLPIGENKDLEKISYVVGVNEWNLYIGAGRKIENINDQIIKKKSILLNSLYTDIFYFVLYSILFIIIFYYLFRKLKKKFDRDIIYFTKLLEDLVITDKKIKYDKIKFLEFENIAKQINKILENKLVLEKELEEKNTLLIEQIKMASLGEMIGNIAHQWRQPLSVISTGATGMKVQKEFNTLDDENFYRVCDTINDHAQYLSRTIDDFKNFIKGDRKKIKYNLSSNIDSFLHLVDGAIKSNNISIILDIDKSIEIKSYPNELTQCLINIFNNAKDVLNDNVERNKLLFISAKKEQNSVVIKIKDNANGIASDILPKVFEPYFTTKHPSQGTGIGLHMTYNLIVDSMGGTITVENAEYYFQEKSYKGAEFTIRLPYE